MAKDSISFRYCKSEGDAISPFKSPNNPVAIATNIFIVLSAIFLIVRYWKVPAFWYGVGALFLLTGLRIYLYTTPKNEDTPPLYEVKDGKCIKTTFLPIPDGVMYVTAPTTQTEVEMCNCDKTC